MSLKCSKSNFSPDEEWRTIKREWCSILCVDLQWVKMCQIPATAIYVDVNSRQVSRVCMMNRCNNHAASTASRPSVRFIGLVRSSVKSSTRARNIVCTANTLAHDVVISRSHLVVKPQLAIARARLRLYASELSICLSVRLFVCLSPKCKKRDFLKN